MSTSEISKQDFPAFAQELQGNLYSAPRFTLPLSDGSAELCPYTMEGVVQGVTLTVGNEVLHHQSGPTPLNEYGQRVHNWKLPPLPNLKAQGTPHRLSITDATRLIDTANTSAVFYTGAGMSNAGIYPVLDHWSLQQRLGFVDEDFSHKLPDIITINDAFVQKFAAANEFRQHVAETYASSFIENMFRDAATPGHIALASIIRHYDREPTLLTANYDCKHEADSSRLQAVKIVRGWHYPEQGGQGGERVRNMLAEIGEMACQLLVVSGAFNDTRGMFHSLKTIHPELAILAITREVPEQLSYIGTGDFYMGGDLHQVLPAIAERL
jgi:hypothetical protein